MNDRICVFVVADVRFEALPLALGMIQAYAECDRMAAHRERYKFMRLLNMPVGQMLKVGRAFGPIRVMSDVAQLIGHPNNDSVYVMTSSSADQLSYEFGDDMKHGAFTYYLLQSAAQTPVSDVTIDNAYTFAATSVEDLVKRLLDKEQKPRQWRVGTAQSMVWKRKPQ